MVLKRSDGFAARESGAAAFDWVILAVGVFGLGLAIFSVITADMDERHEGGQQGGQTVIERSGPANADVAPPEVELPLLYPYFDEEWRAEQAEIFASQTDAALLAAYAQQYEAATGPVNARIGMDLLGVIEAEMSRRGLTLPEGHDPAAVIHAQFDAESSPP